MINFEPKYSWTDKSHFIYCAPLQLYGLSKYIIVFYKCKFLNLSLSKVIAKVANLLIHRMCMDYLCYENKTQNKWPFSISNSN